MLQSARTAYGALLPPRIDNLVVNIIEFVKLGCSKGSKSIEKDLCQESSGSYDTKIT